MYNLASNIDELDGYNGIGKKLIDSYGGRSLHEQSHGESFLSIMINRFSKNGLYILDEPEAALSPTRQMSMITRIHDLVNENCQFIISFNLPFFISYIIQFGYDINIGEWVENKNKFLDILLK